MLDLPSPVSTNLPLPADIMRDYTLEYKIRDRDCYREDIEEMSNVQESELIALRAELDRRGPAPLSTEAQCVKLRS